MNDTNSLVSDLLNILQPDAPEVKPEKKPKVKSIQTDIVEAPKEKKIVKEVAKKTANTGGFLSEIDETVKNTHIAKVVIRKDLYEVFMAIKRAKQVKSVSTLLDLALEDYIKRNSDNIKKLIYDSKNHEIF
jgi:23S rRNA U2552 (ribose-2'-O)-methylase RlmE/FtsJ